MPTADRWAPSYAHSHLLADWIGEANKAAPELVLVCEAASRAIDKATGRQFGRVAEAEARWYPAEWFKDRWTVTIDDLMTTDDLVIEIGDEVIDADDYVLTPRNAVQNGRPWTSLEILPRSPVKPNGDDVKITGLWGWDRIPHAIEIAAQIQASRLYSRRHAPFGVVGNPETGEMRLLERLDPDLVTTVAPFKRYWSAV
ncbi:hypothetical protein [Mycolicibacterium sp. CR10]|uniref:hypothetical protein n=1 Tax=Mycolicibacterium sp. CR10 TaxID=2562314 RepID=UPI0010C0976C|nr:hypothetical protein [Mycolicibacterium sp. CR10]